MIDQLQQLAVHLQSPLVILLAAIWVLPWKGVALWRASRNNQLNWFVALLILNTFAVLEIIYIVWFSHPNAAPAIKRKRKK